MVTDTLFRAPPKRDYDTSQKQQPPASSPQHQPPQPSFKNTYTTTAEAFSTDTNATTTTTEDRISIKKDIACIPPAFFVGSQEPQDAGEIRLDRTRSFSIGYGNRRLSRVIPEPVTTEETKEVKEPPKTTVSEFVDPNRGLFGDGTFCKKRRMSGLKDSVKNSNQPEHSTCTIRVFGYPINLTHNIINHFSQYGTILKYEQAPSGNWISITYASDLSAVAALKSNGTVISKNHLIGVSLEPASQGSTANSSNSYDTDASAINTSGNTGVEEPPQLIFKTVQEGTHLFKTDLKKGNGQNTLGSGLVGVSARKSTSLTNNLLGKMKEYVFGW